MRRGRQPHGELADDGIACPCATGWAFPVVALVVVFNTFGPLFVLPFAGAGGLVGAGIGWRLGRRETAAPYRKVARRWLLAGATPALGALVLLLAVEVEHLAHHIGESWARRAARGTDRSACEHLRDELSRDTCFLSVAMRTKNPATCNGVSAAQGREMCRAKVSALLHGSRECDGFPHEFSRDVCWVTAAIETADIAACAHVRDPYNWRECVQQVARARKDETLCESLPAGEQEQCRLVVEEASRK